VTAPGRPHVDTIVGRMAALRLQLRWLYGDPWDRLEAGRTDREAWHGPGLAPQKQCEDACI
jgi:hypothetical protein